MHELECATVRRAGVVDSIEPAQQLRARRVEVVVAVELESLDQGEGCLDLAVEVPDLQVVAEVDVTFALLG